MDRKIRRFCTGCGLCQSVQKSNLKCDDKGFYYPEHSDDKWFLQVCPAGGKQMEHFDEKELWGRHKAVYLGYSNNEIIRKQASSGGAITEIASFLLETKKVDEIIHIGVDPENQTKTKIYYSKTREDVFKRCGSRYAISAPLLEIGKLDFSKKYAFIGKPCDVVALRNYMEIEPKVQQCIKYLLSFFCMGLPSQQAQDKLLSALNCTQESCKSLTYRGNGWPGYATAVDQNGIENRMDYAASWGGYLGRDVMLACKFCMDGIGEMADISCGDAWYLTKEKEPDFTERDGRNVIFARTDKGAELLKEIAESGNLTLEQYHNFKEELPLIQASQYKRRQDMQMRVLAMKFMQQAVPSYPNKKLKEYSRNVALKKKIRTFLGTCKRVLKNSI